MKHTQALADLTQHGFSEDAAGMMLHRARNLGCASKHGVMVEYSAPAGYCIGALRD